MDGETENRQDVDVVEEQKDDTLSSDGVDITQPWLHAQTLAAAAADRSSPGLRRDQSPELASDPPQGTEFSQKRSSSQRLERSSPQRRDLDHGVHLRPHTSVRESERVRINGTQLEGKNGTEGRHGGKSTGGCGERLHTHPTTQYH